MIYDKGVKKPVSLLNKGGCCTPTLVADRDTSPVRTKSSTFKVQEKLCFSNKSAGQKSKPYRRIGLHHFYVFLFLIFFAFFFVSRASFSTSSMV